MGRKVEELGVVRERLGGVEKELGGVREKLGVKAAEVIGLEGEVRSLGKELRTVEGERMELKGQVDELERAAAGNKRKIEGFGKERASLATKAEEFNQEYAKVNAKLLESESANLTLEQKIRILEKDLTNEQSRSSEAAEKISNANLEIESLNRQIGKLNINNENVCNELHSYKEKNLILENQEDLSNKKIRTNESESKSLLETKINEISKLKETKSVLESIIREKETCEKDFVGQIEILRSGAKNAEDLGAEASSGANEKLRRVEGELADRKEEVSRLSGSLSTKNTEVIGLLRKIEVVETEKAELEAQLGKIKPTDAANGTNRTNEANDANEANGLESPMRTDAGSMFGGPPGCTVHSPRMPEVKNIDTVPDRSPTNSLHLIPMFQEKQIMAEKINT